MTERQMERKKNFVGWPQRQRPACVETNLGDAILLNPQARAQRQQQRGLLLAAALGSLAQALVRAHGEDRREGGR